MRRGRRGAGRRRGPGSQRRGAATQSRQKAKATAASVPRCSATSKARPLSGQPMSQGTTIRWPELLMGRNSPSPCRMPRTTARAAVTRPPRVDAARRRVLASARPSRAHVRESRPYGFRLRQRDRRAGRGGARLRPRQRLRLRGQRLRGAPDLRRARLRAGPALPPAPGLGRPPRHLRAGLGRLPARAGGRPPRPGRRTGNPTSESSSAAASATARTTSTRCRARPW